MGIPTVTDRIAQMVVTMTLAPVLEPVFHDDSYGYRPGKSALDAVGKARQRCWRQDWVLDLDIKGFFDSIPHDLLLKAVRKHTDCKWVLLYIERWLKTPVQQRNGITTERTKGIRREQSSVRCWPTCFCTTAWTSGFGYIIQAARSSVMQTTL